MSKRLIVLLATVALLLVGAVPVSAAPGGVPGPPPGHGKSADVDGDVEAPEGERERNGPPDWANAYGKRIKDEFGIPFGHVQQCARAAAAAEAAGEEVAAEGDVKKALEACPDFDLYPFPEDQSGAKAYWLFNFPKVGVETFAT